jgi:hypothetical protein
MPMAREIHALQAVGSLSAWPSIAAASAELTRPRLPRRGATGDAVILSIVSPGGAGRVPARRESSARGRSPR